MRFRIALVAALATVALSAAAFTSSASAAPAPAAAPAAGGIGAAIPCTVGGVAGICNLTVTGFTIINGVVNAVGTVTGPGGTPVVPFQVPLQATGTCRILDLTLGPLHLDLLGLVVDLNQVHLTITAQQGPGNLLGNLLCAVANLLNGNGSPTALQQLVDQLNRALARL
jgi:hypothetical protein